MRYRNSVSRLAGIGLLLLGLMLMAGCRSDWSDIFGFDNKSNDGTDTTAPIDETRVAGLAIAASSRNFDDTADSLRQAIDDGPSQRTDAFDFQTDLATNDTNTNTSTDTTGSTGDASSANGTLGIGSDNGTLGIGVALQTAGNAVTDDTGDPAPDTGNGGIDAGNPGPDTGSGGIAGNTGDNAGDGAAPTDTNNNSDNTDTTRRARVILFDDPARLTPIIQADLRAGLDLPAKVLVYEDGDATVGLAYNDPDYLRARYNVAAANGALTALGEDLQTLAQDAAGGNGVSSRGAVTGLFAGQGIVGAASTNDFDTTLARLTRAIDDTAGVELAATIDHRQLAADAGLSLNPNTLLLVRDTNADADLVDGGRTVAIDLPQKMLVAVNANGQVRVYYNDPAYIAQRHGITGRGDALDTIAGDLAGLAATATGSADNANGP